MCDESTISRAVSGKSVQLPNKRIVPLSIFFDAASPNAPIIKEKIASESARSAISEIQKTFKAYGVNIARVL
jgi:RNA polymerase sigma-54 factor